MNAQRSSQINKFYTRSLIERQTVIQDWIDGLDIHSLNGGLDLTQADHMIENTIGLYNFPMGIATNFLINRKDYLIPMVIEEPSVVAAASNAARMIRVGGGFTTSSDDPIMIGQIQVLDIPDLQKAIALIQNNEPDLLSKVDRIAGSIVKRGGGARKLEIRVIPDTPAGTMLIIHLLYDVRDAMGANAVNTAVEYIAPDIADLTGGRVNLKILSNLTDHRKARAECVVPVSELTGDDFDGEEVAQRIVEASLFAEFDPYRATTHNKGVMNGIDAVVIATGNDWRAIEAGAHAFAARGGSYTSLTQWRQNERGDLEGSIELPLAVGIIGGATRVHPTAQLALKILGVETARELAEIMAAVGLAQNFAAIRALATGGIQQGHMRMHARQLAVSAGAASDMVMQVAEQMIQEKNIRLERAKTIVMELQEKKVMMLNGLKEDLQSRLMRPTRKVGIVGYGAYIPRYRLPGKEVARIWTKGLGGSPIKEKAVAGLDEDVTTMSIEAARNAMARSRIHPHEIRAVWVGSESHPYAVKPTSTIVAESIGASSSIQAADWEFACKAGTEAVQASIGMIGSGMNTYTLSIGMDTAQGRPGDALEYTAASGGAAFVLGPAEEACAVYQGSYSFVTDTPDFWRRSGETYPSHGDRFTGEPAYFNHTLSAARTLMEMMGTTAKDYTYAVFHQPNVKFPSRAAQLLGFTDDQIKTGLLAGEIGNVYSGSCMLGLTAILDIAQPGDRLLMISYGSGAGSDAFDLIVSDRIREVQSLAPKTQDYINRRTEIDYATYCRYRGKLKD